MGWTLGAIFLIGAIPLLPLLVRPLVTHRRPGLRGVARVLAMCLFWLGVQLVVLRDLGLCPHDRAVGLGLVRPHYDSPSPRRVL
jgi:hypothetical protein